MLQEDQWSCIAHLSAEDMLNKNKLGNTWTINVVLAFTYAEILGNKFDPVTTMVKVNTGPSFERFGSTWVPGAVL